MGIIRLVKEGYRLQGTDEQISTWVEEEFTQDLRDPQVLLSMHPNRPEQVGALLIVGRPTYIGRKGLEIGGVIIASDHPNRGVGGAADQLMRHAIEKYDPHFVIGATINIKAMLLRNRVTEPMGFSSMAGRIMLNENWDAQMLYEAEQIEERYVQDHQGKRRNAVIVEVSSEYLEPIHPSMKRTYPKPYDEIQEQIFFHQQLLGTKGTASVILLSIKQRERLQM